MLKTWSTAVTSFAKTRGALVGGGSLSLCCWRCRRTAGIVVEQRADATDRRSYNTSRTHMHTHTTKTRAKRVPFWHGGAVTNPPPPLLPPVNFRRAHHDVVGAGSVGTPTKQTILLRRTKHAFNTQRALPRYSCRRCAFLPSRFARLFKQDRTDATRWPFRPGGFSARKPASWPENGWLQRTTDSNTSRLGSWPQLLGQLLLLQPVAESVQSLRL